jgi:8-oxo-dGTP pyrophosphatase MutT (NUDIX family)
VLKAEAVSRISIHRIAHLDLRFVARRWAFAEERRAQIDAYFARLQCDTPLWNGRVLLLCEHAVSGNSFRGTYLETDYASFLAWRDWGFPDASMRNCFAPAAVQGADGGYLMGEMAADTANAGQVYFPCGTPDPDDRVGDRVDLAASARRELQEETGLSAGELEVDPFWYAVFDGPRIAMIKPMRSGETADALRARVRAYIAGARNPELADMHIVRTKADFRPEMPPFATAFIAHRWERPWPRGRPG